MKYLVLDLDLTTFVVDGLNHNLIHASHELSEFTTPYDYEGRLLQLRFINPVELSNLIEVACRDHEGVIILTAGKWNIKILDLLTQYLDLSELACHKLLNSHFHNAVTDQRYFNTSEQDIQQMSKATRLQMIINSHEELQSKHFVLLDDDINHIHSFKSFKNVIAIHATTKQADKDYYERALKALACVPTNKRNNATRFFEKKGIKRKNSEEQNSSAIPDSKKSKYLPA